MATRLERLQALIDIDTNECVLWDGPLDNGYGKVSYRGQIMSTGRAALLLTVGDPPDDHLYDAAHGPCHDRSCVNPRHLSWKTRKENQRDRSRDGTSGRIGKRLSADEVREIRRRHEEGESQMSLGRKFGISGPAVCQIVNRKTHKDVE